MFCNTTCSSKKGLLFVKTKSRTNSEKTINRDKWAEIDLLSTKFRAEQKHSVICENK